MPKAYAYVRWSTAEQGGSDRDSHARQTTPLEAFTSATGVQVVETIIDKGVSAFRGANARIGQLKGLLDRIESGEIEAGDYIIVESIDRLTRQRLNDSVELIQYILRKGVRIHTAIDNKTYSYDDPNRDLETLLMVGVIAKRAHEESDTKSKRLKSSWAKKRNEAEIKIIRKQCPYGFAYDEKNKSFVIVEDEANEIRKIFERLKYVGILETVKEVNKTSKRKWTRKHIDELIKTKSPLGVLALQRREDNGERRIFDRYVPNYFPKIIDENTFETAVTAVKNRYNEKKNGRRTLNNYNIFRHCIKCNEHNVGMFFNLQGLGKEKKRYAYLVCSNRAERVCECNNRVRFELIFGAFLCAVQRMYENRYIDERTDKKRKEFTWFSKEDYAGFDNLNNAFSKFFSAKDNRKQKEDIRAKQTELLIEKNTLSMLDASLAQFDGIIPRTFIQRIANSEARITELEKEIANLEGNLIATGETLEATTPNEIIELFQTEIGRMKLNSFFINRGIQFYLNYYDKETGSVSITIRLKDEPDFKLSVGHNFPEKSPLKEFGIDDLSAVIN